MTHTHTQITPSSLPAGGGVTLRGSDGQLHPRAPPKPLRVSAIFANSVPPPPRDRDYDPSSFYDELVVQVKKNLSQITHSSVYCCFYSFIFISIWGNEAHRLHHGKFMSTSCCIQVPQSRHKGHVDRLRAEEKWQSRARLTETSFGFLEAEKSKASSELPLLPIKKSAQEAEDWHFEKPQVCI